MVAKAGFRAGMLHIAVHYVLIFTASCCVGKRCRYRSHRACHCWSVLPGMRCTHDSTLQLHRKVVRRTKCRSQRRRVCHCHDMLLQLHSGTPWGDVVTTPCSMGSIHFSLCAVHPFVPAMAVFWSMPVVILRIFGRLPVKAALSASSPAKPRLYAVGGTLEALTLFLLKLLWKAPRGNGDTCCRQY